jgi:hypothetical protein
MSNKADNNHKDGPRFDRSLLAAVLAGVVSLGLIALGFGIGSTTLGLPVVGLGAAAVVITVLALISIALRNLGLSDEHQAFGLPQGSIRAIIAIGLIAFFIIGTIYYFQVITHPTTTLHGLTQAQVGNLTASQILTSIDDGEGTYTVVLQMVASQAGVDLAKQVLTILGTLVTAVSAFYFGTRAAAGRILEAGTRLTSISVTSDSSEPLEVGSERQFSANGTFANGSTADITSQVTWASTNKTTATISPGGSAAGKKEGNTKITATLTGVSGTADLQVVKKN